MRKTILGQPIDTFNLKEAAWIAKMALIDPKQLKITTLNPEMIVNARANIEFQSAINNSHLLVPDGTGITWAMKIVNNETIQRVPGIELAEKILESANELSKKIAIFGGKKNVLEKTVLRLNKLYPKIQIVKAIDGYILEEKYSEVASEIASQKPNIVFVGLGSPLQEIWINKFSHLFPYSIMIGIGGSLDVWSGTKPRAPIWMRQSHLEWLYRVLIEPKRIPRLLKSIPVFLYMVLKAKILKS